MKKILAVLAFVVLAACLVAPKFIAPKYEERVSQLVTNLNSAPGYQARLEALEDTWFTSKKVLHLGYDLSAIDPTLYGQKIELDLMLDAHYGPLLLSDVGVLGWFDIHAYYAGDKLRNKLNWPTDQAFYEASLVMDLMGNIRSEDQIPAFDIDKAKLTFSGYQGKGEFTANSLDYQGQVDQVNIDDRYDQMTLNNMLLTIDIQSGLDVLSAGGLYDGDIALSLEQLTFGDQTNPSAIDIQGAKILLSSLLDQNTQLGKVISHYSVDTIKSDEFNAEDLSLVIEMNNLSNQFFLDYKTFSDTLLADANVTPQEVTLALFDFMAENMNELLAHNPELNITDLSGRLAEGAFSANVNTRLKELQDPISFEQLMDQNFWLWNLIASGNVQADESLVVSLAERYLAQQMRMTEDSPQIKQQVQMILNNFIQQGFIKREKDKLMTQVAIVDGQGKIYDFPFPLAR